MKYNTHMNYDKTKKMLDTLRKLNESSSRGVKTLNEQEEEKQMKDTVIVVDGVEVRLIADSKEDLELKDPQLWYSGIRFR